MVEEEARGCQELAWKQRFLDEPTLNIDDVVEDNTPMKNDGYNEEVNNNNQEEPTPYQEMIIEPNNDELINVDEQEPEQEKKLCHR